MATIKRDYDLFVTNNLPQSTPNPFYPVGNQSRRNVTLPFPLSIHMSLTRTAAQKGVKLNHMLMELLKPHIDKMLDKDDDYTSPQKE